MQRGSSALTSGQIHVELGTGATGTRVAHGPEVVLHAAVYDVHRRVEPGLAKDPVPVIVGFLIEDGGVSLPRAVDRGVESLRRESPLLDDQFPGPLDRLFLEVIAEGPVAQHLEEGVVVSIVADVLEIVVFASRPDALLRVRRAGRIEGHGLGAEKVGHELVHPRIRELQVRRGWHQRSRRHDGVLLLLEEIEEALAQFVRGHGKGARS